MTRDRLKRWMRLLPQLFARAARRRREQVKHNAGEVERLDRIRNPSKYRGK
jgi:hypothetical protein